MRDAELLRKIHETEWIAESFAMVRFDIDNGPVEPVHLPGGKALEQVERDASGGVFMLVGPLADLRPILHIGFAGEAGLIGTSLSDALALIVGLPSLHDAARYDYGDPRLADCDSEFRTDWALPDEDRTRLWAALNLAVIGPLLDHFCAGLRDDRYLPIATEHATRYRSPLD
jgi:hypothetical protein